MSGGKNKQPLGYTIVEVLIVLAVSGLMFVIAANFINGKQQKAAFTQGVNETASRLQDTIEQVTDGKYSDIPFDCTAGGGGALQITVNASQRQGTNPSCVFIGKFLQFFYNNDSSSYEVMSLAADRSKISLGPDVTPVRSSDGLVDLTTQQTIPQHLDLTNSRVTVNGTPGAYGFGFTQSQGSLEGGVADTYASGAQTINLVYSPNLNAGMAEPSAIAAVTGHVQHAKSVSFCLTDGTYYARISLGDDNANGNQLAVRTQMKGTTSC